MRTDNKYAQLSKERKGRIGKFVYPFRVFGYIVAAITVAYTHLNHYQHLSIYATFFCWWAAIYPHAALGYYLITGSRYVAEHRILTLDMFCIGWLTSLVFYAPVLFLPFLITNSTANLALGGPRLFFSGWVSYAIGLLISGFLVAWEFSDIPANWLMILPFSYLIIGTHFFGFLAYMYGSKFRKSKAQIEEQNLRLMLQTDDLTILNEELQQQAEEINMQRQQIEEQNRLLFKQNQSIGESIAYARRIQQAILPLEEEIRTFLPQSFVWYSPKDVVSGDFYWFAPLENQILIAAADCTGHGIPGAFMSLIGNDALHEIVITRSITRPDLILEELRLSINKALRQHATQNQDGMEIGICAIDIVQGQPAYGSGYLYFAGAGIPLFHVMEGKVQMVRGDKIPIGGWNRFSTMKFQLHTIALQKGLHFYLFSDGYTDQFGGPENRKFGRKRLEQLLSEIYCLPVEQQKQRIKDTIENWRLVACEDQLDDLLAIGVKL
ncbi:MAG: SpoIIE family protein phosphatase [Cytophagales bacterium]|nr:SpoIIE family protein phosphatase [Cytophagales bacterium]